MPRGENVSCAWRGQIVKGLQIHPMEFQLYAKDNGETWESLKILKDLKSAIRRLLYLWYGK